MNRLSWLAILMSIAIIALAGFQVYWLRENYVREKTSLELKSKFLFRESLVELQMSKLRIDDLITTKDSTRPVRVFVRGQMQPQVRMRPRQEFITSVNILRDKMKAAGKARHDSSSEVIVTMDSRSIGPGGDTFYYKKAGRSQHIYNLLSGVDSLQGKIRPQEVDSAFAATLKEEGLSIPYTIVRNKAQIERDGGDGDGDVTIGLSEPVTYKLQLGNAFSYLIKRITLPILFSLFLIGITVASFVALYRTLLKQHKLAVIKNDFINNVTHELKTPIATVGVAIEALKSFNAISDPARTKEYLDISSNELQRLNLLVDKVLKLSMFEKKEVELKYEKVNMAEVSEEVLSSFKLQLEKHNADVQVTYDGDLNIEGDRLHLVSVLFNLIDNSIKYSSSAPVIRISISGDTAGIILRVADEGIGIDQEYHDKIFDKFFRVPQGNKHNAKGYGLGLSYVAQVVQKHGGTIGVESQVGKGTTLIIKLPR